MSFRAKRVLPLIYLFVCAIDSKIYKRCELARELRDLHYVPFDQLSTWVCIAYHESKYDTAARNSATGDHGIFQISELFWCSASEDDILACGVPCSSFQDDDIEDDVVCAKRVYRQHQRLTGDGFNGWAVYRQYCKDPSKSENFLKGCFGKENMMVEEKSLPSENKVSVKKEKGLKFSVNLGFKKIFSQIWTNKPPITITLGPFAHHHTSTPGHYHYNTPPPSPLQSQQNHHDNHHIINNNHYISVPSPLIITHPSSFQNLSVVTADHHQTHHQHHHQHHHHQESSTTNITKSILTPHLEQETSTTNITQDILTHPHFDQETSTKNIIKNILTPHLHQETSTTNITQNIPPSHHHQDTSTTNTTQNIPPLDQLIHHQDTSTTNTTQNIPPPDQLHHQDTSTTNTTQNIPPPDQLIHHKEPSTTNIPPQNLTDKNVSVNHLPPSETSSFNTPNSSDSNHHNNHNQINIYINSDSSTTTKRPFWKPRFDFFMNPFKNMFKPVNEEDYDDQVMVADKTI